MNNFFEALTTKDMVTENGMATHSTSGSFCLDLFYRMAATRQGFGWNRNQSEMWRELLRLFNSAWVEDPEVTLKMIFYLRDVRGGQGERLAFRILFRQICLNYPEVAIKNLVNVPFYGRWDDLFCAYETPVQDSAYDLILHGLKSGDKLCAKWMPRENKSFSFLAKSLMKYFELSPRQYRKLLSGNTEVVENLMCKREWEKINYSHVPSNAMLKYRKAFRKRDTERFLAFLESLKKGESKINSKVLYPHEIVKQFWGKQLEKDDEELLQQMWDNLPDFVGDGSFITVNDVSGSMSGDPMLISVSLGIYLSQRNKSVFRDGFITFSGNPKLQYLKGSLRERINQLHRAEWGYNTNLEAVFDLILNKAKESNLKNSDLPKCILIISDMQFDQCVGMSSSKNDRYSYYSRNSFSTFNPTALEMIKDKYNKFGYDIPRVVFWNVRNSQGIPAKKDDFGVALVSGYSPSIMMFLLKGELDKFSPIEIVKDVVYSERYERVNL